jgi:hypothetical protein
VLWQERIIERIRIINGKLFLIILIYITFDFRLPLTARQYGEVVLPDDSTGQGPGTLARKLSRCKEGMARVFAVMVQILMSITRVAVQV